MWSTPILTYINNIWVSTRENLTLLHVNNTGPDQPVHLRSLISTFVFPIIHICNMQHFNTLASPSSWADWIETNLPENFGQGFSRQGQYTTDLHEIMVLEAHTDNEGPDQPEHSYLTDQNISAGIQH